MKPVFLKSTVLVCLGPLAFALSASAAPIVFEFSLSGAQEVPPVTTPASGSAIVTLNPDTNLLEWDVSFSNLLGTYTNAHFHGPAMFGENAGVILGISQPEVVGQTSGQLTGSSFIDETFKQRILDGLTYINIHSSLHPGGEIRGQVIPEPGTYALIAGMLSLAGVWFWRRRGQIHRSRTT
jgi:hypothetical protein